TNKFIVYDSDGSVYGYVKQKGSFLRPKFYILDENHEIILNIEGPLCILDGPCFPRNQNFRLLTLDERIEIGKIQKEYSGFVKEMFTAADKFGIEFPVDLSVKIKATLIGALFLIVSLNNT
ncbi:phospholipid scramblase 2-like isoform X1, partial [Brachionus plicatilis]